MDLFINKEADVLDEDYRKMIIKEINGDENISRKEEMKKRHDIYRDLTKKYVLELVREEQGDNAFSEILHRVSNVSIAKKIINKKSGIYANGVRRQVVGVDEDTRKVELLEDLLEINQKLKKTNRYVELFKNTAVQVIPWLDESNDRYRLLVNVLAPYKYDVIADRVNPEHAKVYVTSYFNEGDPNNSIDYAQPGQSGKREGATIRSGASNFRAGDAIDQSIANSPNDQGIGCQHYVWWTSNYHFTTDKHGKIIPGLQEDNYANPIGALPFVNYSADQDGNFWAVGGEDLIDGSVLLNLLMSDMYYIAKFQGMGLGYLFGKGVPKNLKVGPASFISLEVQEGDPTPQIGFANASPPIQDHMKMIEQYTAYLLSTNNLEPGTIQGSLSATSAESGVQEMVRKAELVEEQEDKRDMYLRNEYKLFAIIQKWIKLFGEKKLLVEDLKEIGAMTEMLDLNIKFKDAKSMVTETEKLDIIDKRKLLGLDTRIDSLILDNPELSRDEAEDKLKELMEAELLESRKSVLSMINPEDKKNFEEKDEVEDGEDDIQA